MSFRSAQIFVQPKTARLLRLVAKLYPERSDSQPKFAMRESDLVSTPDQWADTMLQVVIAEKFPLATELAKKQDALEKEYTDKAKQ